MVAIPGVASFAPDDKYSFDKFVYNNETGTYTCPQGQTLSTNGNWYVKSKERYLYHVKHYKTTACSTCAAFAFCNPQQKRTSDWAKWVPVLCRAKQEEHWKEYYLLQKAASHHWTHLWYHKRAVGLLVCEHQKRHQTSLSRWGTNVYSPEPASSHEYHWEKRVQKVPRRACLTAFCQNSLVNVIFGRSAASNFHPQLFTAVEKSSCLRLSNHFTNI